MIEEGNIIARVQGIIGNVTVRGFISAPDGRKICCIYTREEQLLYVDSELVQILEV